MQSLVVAYGGWPFTKIEPYGASSEKRSEHIYFMEDDLLHAMSKLHHVCFIYVLTKVLRIFKVAQCAQVT